MFSKRKILFLSVLFFCIYSFSVNATSWCQMLTEDMQRYDQGDNFFHSGNAMQHSIWVLRNVANWFKEKKEGEDVIWLDGINVEKYKQVLILTAFLHDIGKCGDNKYTPCSTKVDHPIVGFKYLVESLNNKKSSYKSETPGLNEFDFTKLFEELGLTKDDIKLSAITIRMHYGLGNVMKAKYSENSIKTYLSEVKNAADEVVYPVSEELIKLCILISAADVKGFDPIDYSTGMFEGLKICPEWAENIGVAHKSKSDGWGNWGYGTNGPKARSAILKYYEQHKKDYDNGTIVLQKLLRDLQKNLKQLNFKLGTLSDRLNHLNSNILKVN